MHCFLFWGFLFLHFSPGRSAAQMKDQTESRLKDLEHVRDLQKAAEEKLRECQESLLSCQKSCVDKSKAIRELQVQVRGE